MIFRVTSYLELHNATSICCTSHALPKLLNRLIGHHKTLTNLLGLKLCLNEKEKRKKASTLNGFSTVSLCEPN